MYNFTRVTFNYDRPADAPVCPRSALDRRLSTRWSTVTSRQRSVCPAALRDPGGMITCGLVSPTWKISPVHVSCHDQQMVCRDFDDQPRRNVPSDLRWMEVFET
jgi:hypothetical protein